MSDAEKSPTIGEEPPKMPRVEIIRKEDSEDSQDHSPTFKSKSGSKSRENVSGNDDSESRGEEGSQDGQDHLNLPIDEPRKRPKTTGALNGGHNIESSEKAKKNFEEAAKVFQDINMNYAMLQKLREELINVKNQYAENELELAEVNLFQ